MVARLLLLALVAALLAPAPARAQRASVSGLVRDSATGETLLGANVSVGAERGAATNTSGFYVLPGMAPGSYTVVFSFLGYRTYRQEIDLGAGEERRLDAALVPEAVSGEEVVVEAELPIEEQAQVGLQDVPIRLVQDLPAVFESDLFRSIQLLPGVKSASDYSSKLYVRGGSPDQTLILLDGTTVYNPTHFFGFFSTFNTEAIKDVRFYKGAYPATYGGRLGSVIDVYNRDGNRNRYEGMFQVGLLASRAGLEGPLALGGTRGSFMLAVRRSTLEPLLAALRESLEEDAIPDRFYFYDINAKLGLDLGPRDRISIATYVGRDIVSIPFSADARFDLDYGNRTVSLGYTRLLSSTLFANTRATASQYFSYPTADVAGTSFSRPNTIYDLSGRADVEWVPGSAFDARAGAWGGYLNTRLRSVFDEEERINFNAGVPYGSAYAQGAWRPGDGWIVTGGLRADYFGAGNYLRVGPRLQVERTMGPNVLVQLAGGRYQQFLTLISNEAFAGFDTWVTTGDGVRPAWGDQLVLGIKARVGAGLRLETEVYGRTMRDLFEIRPGLQDVAGLDYADLFRTGEGYAAGWEILLQRDRGALTGLIGYTLGTTRRRYPTSPGFTSWFAPKYDRLHDVTAVLSYQIGRGWSVTSAATYATGQAYTEPISRYRLGDIGFIGGDIDVLITDELNNRRLPPYHRVDLGMARRGTVFGARYELQLQVINVYNRRNLWFYQLNTFENPIERIPVRQLPVLPNVSFEMRF